MLSKLLALQSPFYFFIQRQWKMKNPFFISFLSLIICGCVTSRGTTSSPTSVDACHILPQERVSVLTERAVTGARTGSLMDAVQMYTCSYALEERGSSIAFSIMDFSQPNPDPAMRLKGRTISPPVCRSFSVGIKKTVACVGDVDQFSISVVGPAPVINERSGPALIKEAISRLNTAH